jgi:hypothetical protein
MLLAWRAGEDDRAGRSLEQRFFFWRKVAECPGSGEVANHHGEGFAVAVLAGSEIGNRGFARGVYCEMKASDAFDGEDLVIEQEPDDGGDWVVGFDRRAVWGFERKLWAAVAACVGLGVEATIERIVVFGMTSGAHVEIDHGGLRAVVGYAPRDGEARAAVGAVEKWVAIPPIYWVEELAEAVGASRGVGGDASRDLTFNFA